MFPSNKFIPISFHRLFILLCAFETRTFGREGWWGRHNIAKKLILMSCCLLFLENVGANHDAKLLYDDLLSSYNRLIRPVGNSSDRLTVKMGLKLSQIIGVDMKRQIMITNVWVEQEWLDYKLKWNPEDYGGVKHLHVPSQHIWLPDIVLYNNADGNYEVTIMTKAVLHYNGKVVWNPPAIYKSSCEIDVEFFPFDEQKCFMKFGSWTYDGYMVDLRHLSQKGNNNNVKLGMDLQEYYISTEWDVMSVPAIRNEKYYPCCEEPYIDITFTVGLRRKSLFYTVNVIIPCVGISFLSVLVFYLPSDSGEKVSLSISILLSLTVFFLLLAEIIPSTSIAVPLLGKYLLFTMILVTFSVVVTIGVLNVNFRTPATHKMAPWVRKAFIDFLPRFLFIKRPDPDDEPLTWNHNQEGTKGSNSKLPISRSLTTTQDSTDDEMDDGGMGQGNTSNYMHSIDHNRSILSNNVNNKPPLQQLQLHAPSCDGSLLGVGRGGSLSNNIDPMSMGSSLPRSGPHHSSSLARSGGSGTWKTSGDTPGRGHASEYTNYMMSPSSQHHNKNPSTQLMGLINGNGNGPGNGDPYMTKQAMSSDLSSPWHPHPPSLLHPPPLIPHHMQSDHHSHHSSSTLHSQQNLQHHDNIVSLNDVNGGIGPNGGPDPNEESATSDLATSFFGYSDYDTRLSKSEHNRNEMNPAIEKAMNALKFVAQHVKNEDNFNSFSDDWKYVAMVLDRILLWIFTVACVVGTAGIIMAAPSHYDIRQPIDVKYSKIDKKNKMMTQMMHEELNTNP